MTKAYLPLQQLYGFTLTELMTALFIGTLILTLSTPMVNLVRANTANSLNQEFARALNLARSEAIKRGKKVTICKTNDGIECDTVKNSGEQQDWSNGWLVFSDVDGNGQIDIDLDTILLVHEALPSGYTLRSNARVRVTYNPIGISPGYMDTWTLCSPGNKTELIKGVIVAYTGRVRLAIDSNHNGTIDNGTPFTQNTPRELTC